jgi:glycosyltransferase involved in cell wall biosynthesis
VRLTYVITRGDSIGGAQVHVRDLATHCASRGHYVTVVTGAAGPLTDQLAAAGIESRICTGMLREVSPRQDIAAVRDLTAILRELKSELVSTHSSKAGIIGRLAAWRAGVPAIFTAHGWAFTGGVPQPRRTIYRMVERGAERLARRIVCVSEHDRAIGIAAGMDPERLITVHNGMPDVDPSLRADPGSEGLVRLVMTARYDRQKDHETLFRALTSLPDVQLDLIGDGPDRSATEALAEQLGIAGQVRFLGQRLDVGQHLARAHVFVLSSRWEGFPRSTLEAMRAGLPVVVSRVGGAAEAVDDGRSGFVVDPGDREQLAERLRDLVHKPTLRASMGAASRARYETEFTFDRMFVKTFAVYEQALAQMH